MDHTDRRHLFEPRGLVAGRCDARGMGDVIDHATRPHPALRDLPVGEAVHAMVRATVRDAPAARTPAAPPTRAPRPADRALTA